MRTWHIGDEDLVLFLDGELRQQRCTAVRKHLEACQECRARLSSLQDAAAAFIAVHHRRFTLPLIDGPRALLRARLHGARNESREYSARIWTAVLAGAAALIIVSLSLIHTVPSASLIFDKPNTLLTPGESTAVTAAQVCSSEIQDKQQASVVSTLERRVFERYGMHRIRLADFEVDHLITPELGGATSLQNLWPEPYRNTIWNAHVKDQLEVRLHELVCTHAITLETAQNDIASDWIAAYRKYFRTDRPISDPNLLAATFMLLNDPNLHADFLQPKSQRECRDGSDESLRHFNSRLAD